jgi:hypothetical protein
MNKKEYFEIIDLIKEKDNISMTTACKYLVDMHGLSYEEAIAIINEWVEAHSKKN